MSDTAAVERDLGRLADAGVDGDTWSQVCALLTAIADDRVDSVIDAVAPALDRWPDAVRAAPAPWVDRLGRSGHEPRVQACRVLSLGRTRRAAADVHRIVGSDDSAAIVRFDLAGGGLDVAAARRVGELLRGRPVRELDVSDNPVGDAIPELLGPGGPHQLETLYAVAAGVGDAHLGRLAGLGLGVPLRALHLGVSSFRADGVAHLAATAGIDRLETLSLRVTKILTAGVEILASSMGAHLRRLDLSLTQCGDAGAAAIATSPTLHRLESLSLAGCHITAVGVASLARSPGLAQLRCLQLDANRLGAAGARAVAEATGLAALRELRLEDCDLGDDGVLIVAGSPLAARLDYLALHDPEISDQTRAAVLALPHLQRVNVPI